MITIHKGHSFIETIELDINEIPFPTAIYILSTDTVILNDLAFELLGMKENEIFDLTTWKKMNPKLDDMIKKHEGDSVSDQKVRLILLNGKHEIMNYSLACFSNSSIGKIYLILFCIVNGNQSVNSFSSLYTLKEEITKLKPYLNRTGKVIHRTLMNKYFGEENQQLTLDDLISYEKDFPIIQETHPLLTDREVVLCCLLVNDFDILDIALITNRTPESVSATIHRINKKLDFMNRKELVNALKELVQVSNSNNDEPAIL